MQRAFEKIIERLEEEAYDMEICEEQFDMNSPYFKDVLYKMVKIDDIKKIVNQVASEVGEEVCEWREDMTLSRSAIGHGKFESLMYVCKWEYCPYCGKKIKIVEPYKAESEG